MSGHANKIMEQIVEEYDVKAAIFDLDGTMIDNNPYHLKAWRQFLEDQGRQLTNEEYNLHLNGRTNEDVIRYLYGNDTKQEQIARYTQEKEAVYRELYKPFITPVKGLTSLLKFFRESRISLAIATSGIQPNIDFMFENLPVRDYFPIVVNSSHISRGKPDPEIYIKTASLLDLPPRNCLVFEDSVAGIRSGKAAGMTVIAVATTHPRVELAEADLIIDNFTFENMEVPGRVDQAQKFRL